MFLGNLLKSTSKNFRKIPVRGISYDSRKVKIKDVFFEFLCLIIVAVSTVDFYYLGKTRCVIMELEQNPVGRYLIELDKGDISIFMAAKFFGTIVALYLLFKLKNLGLKHIFLITSIVALAQIILLIYLLSPA